MKAKSGFGIKQVADSFVIVPMGERLVDFSAMITINETGAFLWNCLNEDVTDEELCEDFIMPDPFDPRLVDVVANAVKANI